MAIEMKPNNVDFLVNRAQCYYDLASTDREKYQLAIADLE